MCVQVDETRHTASFLRSCLSLGHVSSNPLTPAPPAPRIPLPQQQQVPVQEAKEETEEDRRARLLRGLMSRDNDTDAEEGAEQDEGDAAGSGCSSSHHHASASSWLGVSQRLRLRNGGADFRRARAFVLRVKQRFEPHTPLAHQQGGEEESVYRAFLEVLRDFVAEEELDGAEETEAEAEEAWVRLSRRVLERVLRLFEGHPDLVQGFCYFLPECLRVGGCVLYGCLTG